MSKTVTTSTTAKRVHPRAKAKPVLLYADLLKRAMDGAFGPIVQRFYQRAETYHAQMNTAFPRPRNAKVELMNPKDAEAFLMHHERHGIPPADSRGQRLYDEMRVQRGN